MQLGSTELCPSGRLPDKVINVDILTPLERPGSPFSEEIQRASKRGKNHASYSPNLLSPRQNERADFDTSMMEIGEVHNNKDSARYMGDLDTGVHPSFRDILAGKESQIAPRPAVEDLDVEEELYKPWMQATNRRRRATNSLKTSMNAVNSGKQPLTDKLGGSRFHVLAAIDRDVVEVSDEMDIQGDLDILKEREIDAHMLHGQPLELNVGESSKEGTHNESTILPSGGSKPGFDTTCLAENNLEALRDSEEMILNKALVVASKEKVVMSSSNLDTNNHSVVCVIEKNGKLPMQAKSGRILHVSLTNGKATGKNLSTGKNSPRNVSKKKNHQ
ncbi:hypothetical protein V6N11_054561 [Hibiscus sabdariffa]|uniref:Uncharacterized protein n=1 Tax=Hibiscus sabdariffa TaxID=183260 RepID=A0ABR2S4A1_9ROSI